MTYPIWHPGGPNNRIGPALPYDQAVAESARQYAALGLRPHGSRELIRHSVFICQPTINAYCRQHCRRS